MPTTSAGFAFRSASACRFRFAPPTTAVEDTSGKCRLATRSIWTASSRPGATTSTPPGPSAPASVGKRYASVLPLPVGAASRTSRGAAPSASAAPSALCAAVGRSKPSATSRRAAAAPRKSDHAARDGGSASAKAGGASASVFAAARVLAGAAGFLGAAARPSPRGAGAGGAGAAAGGRRSRKPPAGSTFASFFQPPNAPAGASSLSTTTSSSRGGSLAQAANFAASRASRASMDSSAGTDDGTLPLPRRCARLRPLDLPRGGRGGGRAEPESAAAVATTQSSARMVRSRAQRRLIHQC